MPAQKDHAAGRIALCLRIKQMIVERLDLPIDPRWITDDQPLFGRGLELDSVDTLEMVLGIEGEFEVSLNEDDKLAFGSVARLAERIIAERPEIVTESFATVGAG